MANDPQTYALGYEGPEVQEILEKSDDIGPATQSKDGLMSAADKEKLDGVNTGAQANVIEQIEVGGVILVPAEKKVVIPVDAAAAQGGVNPVSSGALYAALLNYYTSAEVDQLLAGIKQFTYEVVAELPTASADTMYCIYFVPSTNPATQNVKDEYITVRSGEEGSYTYSWEKIGSAAVDISGKADKDTDAVEGNLAEFDANGNPVDSGVPATKIGEIEEKVTVLRNSAGVAEGIADTLSAGTAQEFVFRQSGGDGVNYMKRIKGKSIVWNQKIAPSRLIDTTTISGVTFTNNADGSITINGTATEPIGNTNLGFNITKPASIFPRDGHTLLFSLGGDLPSGMTFGLSGYILTHTGDYIETFPTAGTWYGSLAVVIAAGTSFNNFIIYPQFFDITQATASISSVAQFRALYPEAYYPYNPGKIISNDASEIETVGRNLWDEEWEVGSLDNDGQPETNSNRVRSKNFIPVIGGQTYYFNNLLDNYAQVCAYDANQNFIGYVSGVSNVPFSLTLGNNVHYIKFRTNNGTTTINPGQFCINLSDPSFNGQYEPYWKRRIELNLSTLKDKDGNLVFPYGGMHGTGTAFDSMKPEVDGFIHYANRVFARVDLGSLTWIYDGIQGGIPRFRVTISGKKPGYNNIICSKYPYNPSPVGLAGVDKCICGIDVNSNVFVSDSAYTDAVAFKAAMDGVYLVYEVATPAVVELAEPIPNAILVDSYGTEKAIFPEHEDGSPSAPFCCDSNYSISVKNLVAFINAQNNG